MNLALLRNPIALIFGLLALLILLGSTFAVVPETQQAVIERLGKPVRIANAYSPGEEFGRTGAGIIARIPFIERIVPIDKRIRAVDMEPQQVLSTDQLRLEVDAYARYRITDPLRMYITARDEENVSRQLATVLGSSLRNELGRQPFSALLSPERGQIMDNVQRSLDRVARQYGAQIVDVRIKRADLPDGTPLESAYQRMMSARRQEARSIQAQGAREATEIRAEADAQASRTYAAAFGKDPQFYDFYRAMQSYRASMGGEGQGDGRSSVILSPNNEYLRQFRGNGQ